MSLILGFAAVAVVMGGRSLTPNSSPTPVSREPATATSSVEEATPPGYFRKGYEVLEEFFGGDIPAFVDSGEARAESATGRPSRIQQPGTREVPGSSLRTTPPDFDVIIASVPDPHESRMDWIYDGLLAAIQRAFETGGFVLDRYWIPDPDSTVTVQLGEEGVSRPAPRVHPGVILFRSWHAQSKQLRLRLVYLVGEVPTRGVHVRALREALREREELLQLIPSPSPDSTAVRRRTVRILGPVFSGSSYSYRRVLERWLADSTEYIPRSQISVRLITGSATSPGNKATLEDSLFHISFSATVNPDDVLMGGLSPLVLQPLGINLREVAILQEVTTAYGQSLAPTGSDTSLIRRMEGAEARAPNDSTSRAVRNDSTPLVIPFPMSISLLRSEYARLPSAAEPVKLIPELPDDPRVPLSLLETSRTPETPRSVSRLTPPTLDIVMEEITRVMEARGIRAVGLMATDVRDKLFLGDQIHRRLPDVQLFTLESNVLLRAPQYRDALRGMLVLSTYPLFLENQERIPGEGRDDLLSFPNDGAQGAYNAALLHLGLDSLMVGYGVPDSTCLDLSGDGEGSQAPPRRPPVWLSAIGNRSLLPISCAVPRDDLGYLVQASIPQDGAGGLRQTAESPSRKGMFRQGAFLLLILAVYLTCGWILLHPVRASDSGGGKGGEEERSIPGGISDGEGHSNGSREGRAEERWQLQVASHRIHLGIYRGALIIGLGGLALPLSFPPGSSEGLILVVLPAALTVLWVATRTLALTAKWAGKGLGIVGEDLGRTLRSWKGGEDVDEEDRRRERWEGPMWALEIVARSLVVVGAVAVGAFLIQYALQVRQMGRTAPGSLDLYVQRAAQWSSGISPLLPMTLGLLGMVGWCLWHWKRIDILCRVRPFEDSTFPQLGQDGCTIDGKQVPPAWEQAWLSTVRSVQDTRMRLFMLVPDPRALAFAVFMGVSGWWLLHNMGRTLEMAALNPGDVELTAWPLLFRGFVVSAILVTGWSIYRFISVWASLRRTLTSVVETPLVSAFQRLPQRVARLTRLTVFEGTSRTILGAVSGTQWRQLQQTFALAQAPDGGLEELPDALRTEMKNLMENHHEKIFLHPDRSEEDGRVLARLRKVLNVLWCREPEGVTLDKVKGALAEERGPTPTNTGLKIRTTFPSRTGVWVRQAEELMATQIVGYVGWALSQVRWLAIFLLFSLVFTTALVSSYPYGNQAEAKVFFFFVALAGILALSTSVVQMNRDDLLSRINGSDPNRVTWNTRLLVNLFVFGGIPLLAILSSAFPPLRNILTAWMGPLMGMLGS